MILLGSIIPLGAALEQFGGTGLIAGQIVDLASGMSAWVVLTALMVVVMTLSDVLNKHGNRHYRSTHHGQHCQPARRQSRRRPAPS